jgi:Xaa-Pro aminopeptidase
MLTLEGSRQRQSRMLAQLETSACDLFVTADARTVYYFTGSFAPESSPTIFALRADGTSLLITPTTGEAHASDIRKVETYSIERSITEPMHDAVRLLGDALCENAPRRAFVERASTPGLVEEVLRVAEIVDATATVLRLRKRKEPDEIEEIRHSLRLCAVAYDAARATIAAGRMEIDVYHTMHAALSREAGMTVAFPGDFACGRRCVRGGGPPTSRQIEAGDLYILDIFPAPAYYAGDTCRAFSVGEPSDFQYRAWERVCGAVRLAERLIRPGVRARDVYAEVKAQLDESFWHHAGHGIGFRGHEAPRIIPGSEDIFETGDVIAVEPGIYSTELHGGIRLEDNYVVRENGLENLFDYPRTL